MSKSLIEQAKNKIANLVSDYDQVVMEGKLQQFSEADVGSKYILTLVDALGWNIKNIDEVKEQRRTLVGPVDYSLNIDKKPRLVVEIKRFSESLDTKRTVRGKEESYPEQAIGYAWHLKVDWVILSNFAETRLYYSHVTKPQDGLIFKFRHSEYLKNFEKLWILSKESVLSGVLDTYEKRRTRLDIDREVLKDLFNARKALVGSIREQNPTLTADETRESVQKILDRVLVIRVAEDRGIIGSDSLWIALESWKTRGLPTPLMRTFKGLFRDFDEIYNSKLFETHKSEDLAIGNDVLQNIIGSLYKYNFDLISADILGAIYEDYIGHILKESEEKLEIVEEYGARKEAGIYYTPTHVVEYICRQTLGPVLQEDAPDRVASIKIIDPACGSGSFLIKAFDILKEYYDLYNKKEREKAQLTQSLVGYSNMLTNVERKILTDNLFGVDLDDQAAEIAAVNLMLKALKKGERLPLILGDNIKCGNSLVSGAEEMLEKFFADKWREEKPFDWYGEFKEIFDEDGFHVVIGNPPHGAKLSEQERKFFEAQYAVAKGYKNTASLFIEKALNLIRSNGILGLVIPKSLTFSERWKIVRDFLLDETEIVEIADISKAFPGVLLEQIILICKKEEQTAESYRGTKLYWGEPVEHHNVPLSICKELDCFPIHIDTRSLQIYEKIKSKCCHFRDVSRTFRGLPIQSIASKKKTENSEPLLRGDDIRPYYHGAPQTFIDKTNLEETEKIACLRNRKIISQRIVAHVLKPIDHVIIMSTIDRKGLLNVDTVENTIVTDSNYDLKYLLAFLNSKLASWYAYTFIFNKAVRTMDFDDYYVGKLPIYPGSATQQKEFAGLVDQLLKSTEELPETGAVFEEYVNKHPRLDDTKLEVYYRRASPEDKKIKIPSNLKGRIRRVEVSEDADWLVFKADCRVKTREKVEEHQGAEILRMKVKEPTLRLFISYSVSMAARERSGNLLEKILQIPIPRYNRDESKNHKVIKEIVKDYQRIREKRDELLKKIKEVSAAIDQKIYNVFSLTEDEREHIEEAQPGYPVADLWQD